MRLFAKRHVAQCLNAWGGEIPGKLILVARPCIQIVLRKLDHHGPIERGNSFALNQ